VETTCGLVSRIGTIATDNALVIRCLKEAGAIPFMKTNLAQATLLVESTNNIFGLVTNPHNRNLSAGGSSGGEGAVVALRGSPLGIGTDGGGSIRLPAAWNGVYGLKPSATRISTLGTSGVGYSDSNLGCIGPLANDLETLSLFTKVILDARPWDIDPACIPMPWNPDVQLPRKLIIGLLLDDGITHLSPPVLRVLEETRQKLTEEGHEVIQLDWSDLHVRGSKIIFTMYTQEGGIGVKEALDASGEPAVPRLATGWSEKPLTPLEIWKNHRARKQLRLEYLQRWKLLKLDAVLTAPSPHPAPPHTQYMYVGLKSGDPHPPVFLLTESC
jgi:amidase